MKTSILKLCALVAIIIFSSFTTTQQWATLKTDDGELIVDFSTIQYDKIAEDFVEGSVAKLAPGQGGTGVEICPGTGETCVEVVIVGNQTIVYFAKKTPGGPTSIITKD